MGTQSSVVHGSKRHSDARHGSVAGRSTRQIQVGEETKAAVKLVLSPKERAVAEYLMRGCSNVEIGREIGMATRTVKKWFSVMFRKAGIKGGIRRVKLAVLLYRQFAEEEKQCSVIN
jgi:DNA-binding NarL/FixJ family response regulator